jgi:hypothetical protein
VCYAVCDDPEDRRLVFLSELGGRRVYWLTAPSVGVNEYRLLASEEERATFDKSYEHLCRKRDATETETETDREGDTEPASQGSPSKRKGGRVESSDAPQHQEEAEEEESGGGATRGTKKQKVQGGTVGISDESATQQSGSARLSEQDLRELSRKQLERAVLSTNGFQGLS